MDTLHMADVAARVVAWHNRYPWVRRIVPADVSGVGVVALPFALPSAAQPGAPAAAESALRPIFESDWLYRAAHRQLGKWSRRHGRDTLPACVGWPLRQIDADLASAHRADAEGLEGRTLRHVLTAVIDSGGHRVRVLLAPAPPMRRAAVLGLRIAHPARIAVAGLALVALLAAGLTNQLLPMAVAPPALADTRAGMPVDAAAADAAQPAVPVPEPVAAAEPPGSPPPTTATLSPGPQLAETEAVAEPPTDPSPIAEPAYERPVDVPITVVERKADTAPLVAIRPQIGPAERRTARAARQALRSDRSGSPTVPMFAIVTPPARTRDDAQAQRVALRGLQAQTATSRPTRLDLMAAQGRWRVVWWPHPQRAQAEELLAQARARGLKVELIDF